MGILTRLKALVPGFNGILAGRSTPDVRRPRPETEERVPHSLAGGIAGRLWFLPYASDTSTDDTPEIRLAMRCMLRDPYVKTAWLSQVLSVLSQDFQVHNADRSKSQEAQDQADFIRHNIENCEGELLGLGMAILMNLGADGYSIAEKVWQVEPRGKYAGRLTLRALKPKDPEDLTLVGDEFRNVTGVRVNRTNETYPITDFTYIRYLHTYDEPCGMAAFRAGYGSYWMRDTVRKLRIIHHEKKSAGFLVGEYTDPADKGGLEEVLKRAKASTWAAVPEGVKIQALALSTSGEPDYKSFDDSLREEILVSIALAHLHILQGGVSDARGDTKVHKTVADLGPWLLTYLVQSVINRQVIPDLIDYNYPAVSSYPRVTLGGVTNQEIQETLQILQGLQSVGFKPSRSYYATALSVQEADEQDPNDQITPPQQASPFGGGMPPPGGGGGDPFGGGGIFANLPTEGGGGGGSDPLFGGPPQDQQASAFSEVWFESFGWTPAQTRNKTVKAIGTGEHQGQILYGQAARSALGQKQPVKTTSHTNPTIEAVASKKKIVATKKIVAATITDNDREARIAEYTKRAAKKQPLFTTEDATRASMGNPAVRERMRSVAIGAALHSQEILGKRSLPIPSEALGEWRVSLTKATSDLPKDLGRKVQIGMDAIITSKPDEAPNKLAQFAKWVGSLGAKVGGMVVRALGRAAWWGIKLAVRKMGEIAWSLVGPPIIWAGQAARFAAPIALHIATLAGAVGLVVGATYLPASIPFAVKLLTGVGVAGIIRKGVPWAIDRWVAPKIAEASGGVLYEKHSEGDGSEGDDGWESFGWKPAQTRNKTLKAIGTDKDQGKTLYGAAARKALEQQQKAGTQQVVDSTQQQSQAAPPPEQQTPQAILAKAVAEKLKAGQVITAQDLWAAANTAYGGTRSQGKYGPSDAYDAMEAGFNFALAGNTDPTLDSSGAIAQAQAIRDRVQQLPTQTNRSGNKDLLQQFSTPPHFAYAVNWLANLKPTDVVLEPSAGTGSLAVHARNAGAAVYTNEMDPKRAAYLASLLGNQYVTKENAEHISAILGGKIPQPSVVVMNPPFSSTGGRTSKKDVLTAGKHIEEAMQMLAPGGRLVAIVGEGMQPGSPRYREWFDRMSKEYSLRANVGVPGSEYGKYGTQFGTRVLVLDKVSPAEKQSTITGDADSVTGMMSLLSGVRDDRPEPNRSTPGEQTSDQAVGAEGVGAVLDDSTSATVPGVAGGKRGKGRAKTDGGLSGLEGSAAGGGDVGGGAGSIDQRAGRGSTRTRGGRKAGDGTSIGAGKSAGKDGSVSRGANAGGKSASGNVVKRPPQKLKFAESNGVQNPADSSNASDLQDTQEDQKISTFERYQPAVKIEGAQPHAASLVESAAMSSVSAPKPTYQPTLSPDLVEKGLLSDAQLETVVYTGQAHQIMIESETGTPIRKGFFLGDGTGVGKGRQISAIIADNMAQGRSKHVWLSQKATLEQDAKRDFGDIGQDPTRIIPFSKIQKGESPNEGVAFLTYSTLQSGPKDKTKPNNLEKLVEWLGPDYDGVIVFDEAHAMANATETVGARGRKSASQQAMAGLDLQRRLPNARVVYVSATGATELNNLAYAERLGLWGPGTAFSSKKHFFSEMERGGVAAMEAVAQSLKAQGSYTARSLSFDDGTPKGKVTYERLTHKLTPEQHAIYDSAANAWQTVLQNADQAIELTGANARELSNMRSQFWGAHQRFFNQMMTWMQTPSVIKSIEADLAGDSSGKRAPVIQLVNTMESATKRALENRGDDEDLDDIDVSPKDILMQYLDKSFPTMRFQEVEDEDGNVKSVPVLDSAGKPVHDQRALELKDRMMDLVGTIKIDEGPLDMIINHFGTDQVAEVTGRKQRLVWKRDANGQLKKVPEKRGKSANLAEADDFQAGRKKILVFSDAGGTGRSYHASNTVTNKDQRVHYMLQPGWRADNAVQGLGRTHRTNQAQAPTYRLVQIDELKGQKRFISTIARRLDQLGALTRGQREAGGSGIFDSSDNMESREAQRALQHTFQDIRIGQVPDLDFSDIVTQMGFLDPNDPKRHQKARNFEAPPMTQFLNRLLSLNVDTQSKLMAAYDERHKAVIEQARKDNTLDTGVENYKAKEIVKTGERVVYRDPKSGAEVKLLSTIAKQEIKRRPWQANLEGEKPLFYVQNNRSGKVRAVMSASGYKYQLVGPLSSSDRIDRNQVDYGESYTKLPEAEAQKLWETEYQAAPKVRDVETHFLTGALLPVWDKIPKGQDEVPRIYRVKPTGAQSTVGRHVHASALPTLFKNFGVDAQAAERDPVKVHAQVASGDAMAKLSNGWKLRPARVGGERRIELEGVGPYEMDQIVRDGAIKERVAYNTRFFIPTGPEGVEVLKRITANRKITDVIDQMSDRGRGRYQQFNFQPDRSRTGNIKAVGVGEDQGETLYGDEARAALERQNKGAGNVAGETITGDKNPKVTQRTKAITEAAKKIPFVDVATMDDSANHTVEEIRSVMPGSAIRWVEYETHNQKEQYIQEKIDKEFPEEWFDEDESISDVWEKAGWTDSDIRDRVSSEVKKLTEEEDWDEEEKSEILDDIDTWYRKNFEGQSDVALGELIDQLEAKWDGVAERLKNLELDVELQNDYKAAIDELTKEKTERIAMLAKEFENDERDNLEEELVRSYLRKHPEILPHNSSVGNNTWQHDSDNPDVESVFQFETQAGKRYKITASPVTDSSIPELRNTFFDRNGLPAKIHDLVFADSRGSFSVTSAGSATEVFTRVTEAVTAYVEHVDPQVMYFTAEEPSRQKLYNRLVKAIATVNSDYMAFSLVLPNSPTKQYFIVRRDIPVDKTVERIKNTPGYQGETLVFAERGFLTPMEAYIDESWFTSDRTWVDDNGLVRQLCQHFAELPNPLQQHDEPISFAGHDGIKAGRLMQLAKTQGREQLTQIARQAILRVLQDPDPLTVPVLFTDEELKQIAASLSASNATAEMLGRAKVHRVAEYLAATNQGSSQKFAEGEQDPFDRFAEGDEIPALAPERAVYYFQSLFPSLSMDPLRYGPRLDRQAFTLAVATDEALLNRVKSIIANQLETGQQKTPVQDIEDVLDKAGVSSRNPQYADMVYRTNMMDSYNQGQTAELQSPQMQDLFPVWQYLGIRDGRQGEDHEPNFDRYFPSDRPFADVRGPRVFNCRCSQAPVSRFAWERIQKSGGQLG